MSSIKSYQDLIVWQKSMFLAKEIYGITKSFPDEEKFGLASQTQRAAVSIPSNIAEGWGRGYSQNFVQFLNIASGSLAELETQIILARDLGYIKENNEVLDLCAEISKMLYSLKRNIKSKQV
jgi:four helix bundle protein